MPSFSHALIVGAGSGLSASLARLFAKNGIAVSLAARNTAKLDGLVSEISGAAYPCDVGDAAAVSELFTTLDGESRAPDIVVYNPSARERGPFADLDPARVENAIRISAYGGFLVAQEAVKRMLPNNHGAVLFTGASASVKGYAQSAPFAMGKFALRGLAQSMARELHPKGVHIGHFVIDGGIRNPERPERVDPAGNPDSMLAPDAIAEAYWNLLNQHRSAWTWEVELRPWVERF